MTVKPEPVKSSRKGSGRLLGIDLARALALIGIMGNHTLADDRFVSLIMRDIHAIMFALLIGVGLELARQRYLDQPIVQIRSALIRGVILVGIGFSLSDLRSTVMVVLVQLGIITIIGVVLVRFRTAILVVLGTLGLVGGPALVLIFAPRWGLETAGSPGWATLAHPLDLFIRIALVEPYPLVLWTTHMIIGILLTRWAKWGDRSFTPAKSDYLKLIGVSLCAILAGAVAAAIPKIVDLLYPEHWNWITDPHAYSGSVSDTLVGAGSAVFLTVSCVWLISLAPKSRILVATAHMGAMTLTWYVIHLLVPHPFISQIDEVAAASWPIDYAYWIGQVIIFVLLSEVWLKYFRTGPLEAIPRQIDRCLSA